MENASNVGIGIRGGGKMTKNYRVRTNKLKQALNEISDRNLKVVAFLFGWTDRENKKIVVICVKEK